MTDTLTARLTYAATDTHVETIPWPEGLAPVQLHCRAEPTDELPRADVVVSAFTYAEGQALAAVLSPGLQLDDWIPYAKGFEEYEHQLTDRSPARESRRLCSYTLVEIGTKRVLLAKFELHPATDGPSLPTAQLWRQIAAETGASVLITHGTAGAVQETTVLGDVIVAEHVRWDCQGQFKSEPWADDVYACASLPATTTNLELAQETLLAINAARLAPTATRLPVVWTDVDTITTDFFAFDDAEDHYGLRNYDANARAVEMDDAACGLAVAQITENPPAWYSVRNASDPQIAQGSSIKAEDDVAAHIYQTDGFTTTVGSAIVCWAIIADL